MDGGYFIVDLTKHRNKKELISNYDYSVPESGTSFIRLDRIS